MRSMPRSLSCPTGISESCGCATASTARRSRSRSRRSAAFSASPASASANSRPKRCAAWPSAASSRRSRRPRSRALRPYDLADPAARARAVELDEEHALPGAEAQLAVADRDRLARRAEDHRHAVGVAVRLLFVFLADVFRAAIPIVVRVVRLVRHETAQQRAEVLEHAALVLVDAHTAGRVGGVDAADPIDDTGLANDFRDLGGDVGDVQAAAGLELTLRLEHLHRRRSLTSTLAPLGPDLSG